MIKRAVVLGVSADIGQHMCRYFQEDGYEIIGTWRQDFPARDTLESLPRVSLLRCDLSRERELDIFASFLRERDFRWTHLLSAVGCSEPIGRFFELEFSAWQSSFNLNSTVQLGALHKLYPLRERDREVKE